MIVISGIEYIPGGQGYFNLIISHLSEYSMNHPDERDLLRLYGLRYGPLYFAGQCSAILHTTYTDSFARLMYCA